MGHFTENLFPGVRSAHGYARMSPYQSARQVITLPALTMRPCGSPGQVPPPSTRGAAYCPGLITAVVDQEGLCQSICMLGLVERNRLASTTTEGGPCTCAALELRQDAIPVKAFQGPWREVGFRARQPGGLSLATILAADSPSPALTSLLLTAWRRVFFYFFIHQFCLRKDSAIRPLGLQLTHRSCGSARYFIG